MDTITEQLTASNACEMGEAAVVPPQVRALVSAMDGSALAESRIESPEWQEINRAEQIMAALPQQHLPLKHVFTPGLYTRQIFMPAGTLLTSRIHLFEHPFIISAGVVSVWGDERGWETLQAPYLGVTKPATRRVLYIHQDTIWTTFHVTNETDPEKIGEQIVYPHAKIGHLDAIPEEQMAAIKRNQRGQLP